MNEYEIGPDGKRMPSIDSYKKIDIQILSSLNLYPIEISEEKLKKISKVVSKSDISIPVIFLSKDDIYVPVFASLWYRLKYEVLKDRYFACKVIDVSDLVDNYFSDSNVGSKYDYVSVLFIRANYVELPHMYNALSMKSIAEERKAKGLYTYFFFRGSLGEIKSDRWKVNINGISDSNVSLEPILNYISYVDLDEFL